jgi:drug/metabolite transporter (DMT)-like permease
VNSPLTPRLALLLTLPPLLWAGNAVVGRLMAGDIPPVLFNALRWAGAALLLLPLGWRAFSSAESRAQIAQRWGHLALLGLLGVGVYNALQYMALRTSTPLNVTLIASSIPLWMMAVGALAFRVRPTRRDLLAAALSLLGVAVVLTRGELQALARVQLVAGDVLMLAATACWAGYSWLLARPPASMRGSERPAWDWAEFLLVQVAFGLAWSGAAAAAEQGVIGGSQPVQWSWALAAALAYVALCPSVLAYRAWGAGVAGAGPAMAALFSNLTPLFAALISGAVLGLWPQPFHIVAFALIVAGIAVSARRA